MKKIRKTNLIYRICKSKETVPVYSSFIEDEPCDLICVEEIGGVYGYELDEFVKDLKSVTYPPFFIEEKGKSYIVINAYNMSVMILVIKKEIKKYSVAACDVARSATCYGLYY